MTQDTAAQSSPDSPFSQGENSGNGESAQPRYKLVIDDNVVEKISALSVQKIDGIIDMKGSLLSTIQEGLGGNSQTKGIDADVIDDQNARIDLDIILEYGKSAPEVFERIKQVIAEDLKSMTGLDVFEMTVNVVDVMSQEEYDQKKHGNGSDGAEGKQDNAS